MGNEFFLLAIMLTGIPAGLLIAWLCRDELIQGRKWFKIIISVSVLAGLFFFFAGKFVVSMTFMFIIIVSFISLMKSFDKSWTMKKI